MRKKVERVIDAVWYNEPPKRYRPRSYNGGTGWGVWDAKLSKWVEPDSELLKIDPHEEFLGTPMQ